MSPWQPLWNHPSGHFGGWATLWLAEEMLDGQHQRVDIPVHARTVNMGLLQERLEEDLCFIIAHVHPTTNLRQLSNIQLDNYQEWYLYKIVRWQTPLLWALHVDSFCLCPYKINDLTSEWLHEGCMFYDMEEDADGWWARDRERWVTVIDEDNFALVRDM